MPPTHAKHPRSAGSTVSKSHVRSGILLAVHAEPHRGCGPTPQKLPRKISCARRILTWHQSSSWCSWLLLAHFTGFQAIPVVRPHSPRCLTTWGSKRKSHVRDGPVDMFGQLYNLPGHAHSLSSTRQASTYILQLFF